MDYALQTLLAAQQMGRNDAERFEMLTGRRAPWARNEGCNFSR